MLSADTRAPSNLPASGAPQVKGWCPGALRPMLSGDGMVVRVRPPLGRLTPMQGHGLALLAQQYAFPTLEITSRANLQLRGVGPDAYLSLLGGLSALGLLDERVDVEARRNLLVSPFWNMADSTLEISDALNRALAAPNAPALPGKFGFVLDLGCTPVLRDCSADIRLERRGSQCLVYPDGSSTAAMVPLEQAVHCAMALAQWFIASGGVVDGRGRMANLLQCQTLPAVFTTVPVPPPPLPQSRVGLSDTGFVVGLEFGQLPANVLAHLSRLAPLRITPWRSIVLEGVHAAPDLPELITQPHDLRLRVMACAGAPGCNQARGPTRTLARFLAPLLPVGQTAHVSGCAKGCAHRKATLTVVATGAGYDLVENGRANSLPSAIGLDAAGIAAYLEQQQSHAPYL